LPSPKAILFKKPIASVGAPDQLRERRAIFIARRCEASKVLPVEPAPLYTDHRANWDSMCPKLDKLIRASSAISSSANVLRQMAEVRQQRAGVDRAGIF
jgi:hypothetical protein